MKREIGIEFIAIRYGISEEDAAKVYEQVITVADKIVGVFDELKNLVLEFVERLHVFIENRETHLEENLWVPVLDTRKPSQVLLNKPRFLVRKII